MARNLPFRGHEGVRFVGVPASRPGWKPFVAGFLLASLCLLEIVLLMDALGTGASPAASSVRLETQPPEPETDPRAGRSAAAPGTAIKDESPDIAMPPPFMLASPMVSAESGLPLPLWYELNRHPGALCAAIGPGDDAQRWAESELVPGYWECYGDAAEAGSGFSLFSMLRGRSAAEVGEIRLKVTIEDEDIAPEARRAFLDAARKIFEIVGLPGEAIGETLFEGSGRREKPVAGARLIMSEEGAGGRSHNLIVLLPPAAPSFATVPFEYMSRLPGRVVRPARRP